MLLYSLTKICLVLTMAYRIHPFHIIVIALAGWMNRQQQAVIEYLIEENRILKSQYKGKWLTLSAVEHPYSHLVHELYQSLSGSGDI